jgi:hypothetical protein
VTSAVFELRKAAELDRLVDVCNSLGLVGRVELLRAVRAGVIARIEPDRLGVPLRRVLDPSRRPTLVVLGDDDYASTGPSGWAALPRLLRWARGALVHGSGADAASYQAAIAGALATDRFVLVETSAQCAPEWGRVFDARGVPVLVLLPREGTHPAPVKPEEVQ